MIFLQNFKHFKVKIYNTINFFKMNTNTKTQSKNSKQKFQKLDLSKIEAPKIIVQKIEKRDVSEIEKENEKQMEHLGRIFKDKSVVTNEKFVTFLGMEETDKKDVKIYDSQTVNGKNIYLIQCVNNSNEKFNHIRGMIVTDEKIICKTHSQTQEVMTENFNVDPKDAKFFPGYEGTVLRVFFFENKWFVSTQKKLDGYESSWGCPKFGQLFCECLGIEEYSLQETLDQLLNKNYCYVFLVSHPQNTLVCKYDKPRLFHIETFDIENQKIIDEKNTKFNYSESLVFETTEQVQDYVNKMSTDEYSGLLCFRGDKSWKITNKNYYIKRLVRGNEPNIAMRYLQLKNVENFSSKDLVQIIPEKREIFEKIEANIFNTQKILYSHFLYRYINGNYLRIPKIELIILDKIFEKYKEFKGQLITFETAKKIKQDIQTELGIIDPVALNSLMKEINIFEQKQYAQKQYVHHKTSKYSNGKNTEKYNKETRPPRNGPNINFIPRSNNNVEQKTNQPRSKTKPLTFKRTVD